jgi:hypothetical protein
MYAIDPCHVRLTSDGHFDLKLTTSGLRYQTVVNKYKWLANLLYEKCSLCRHAASMFHNKAEEVTRMFER